ncbi:MAG: MG2 domain-containing protein [Lentimicrobiaceae bacterium]|nr:MG2 domain-containing protein [Lentimicrobiaceae bacterium]
MKYSRSLWVAVLFATGLLVGGCGGEKIDGSHPYVEAFTSGEVSALTPIVVKFTDEVRFKESYELGQVLDKKLFKIKPSVDGEAVWKGDNTVEFVPKKPLKRDKRYVVRLNIAKIAVVKDVPKTFTFDFQTVKLAYSYTLGELTCYDMEDENTYYLSGNIYTSDYVDDETAEKILKIKPNNYAISWSHDRAGRTHAFRIDSVRSETKEYFVALNFDGTAMGDNRKAEETIRVPKKNVFEFLSVNVEYAPEFVVTVSFSSPIDDKQSLKNKISLSNLPFRYVVDMNKIRIYPTNRATGVYTLKISKNILNKKGKTLDQNIVEEVVFEEIKPTVKFLGKGVILPSEYKMSVPFLAINYREVEVTVTRIFESNILQFLQESDMDEGGWQLYRVGKEVAKQRISLGSSTSDKLRNWNTYSIDLSKLIAVEPGAIYRVEIQGKKPLKELGAENNDDDDEDYYDYYDSYYTKQRERVRNILASDLGITVKMDGNNNVTAFVANLITAQPEANVSLKVYDFTNQPMCEGKTNSQGIVSMKYEDDVPHVVIATKGNQKGYLKVNSGNNLSLSNFDVAGTANKKGLKGYIYGERGVWRPGDKIYLTFVLMDKNDILPKNHPVKLDFQNPSEQIVYTQTKTVGIDGIYCFELKTDADAPTGNWRATVTVGGESFSSTIKIETVKPNKLKINFNLNDKPFLKANNIQGKIASSWLHGAKAPNLKTDVQVSFSKIKTVFKGYETYTFDDITRDFETEERVLVSDKLDENGDLSFTKSLSLNPPGMLKAQFTVRVFEPSGDFSIDQYTTSCIPYTSLVGLKMPESKDYYQMITTDKQHKFTVATLNDAGKPISVSGVKVEIYKLRWNWWWYSSGEGLASYSQSGNEELFYSATLNTTNGIGSFTHKWSRYDWGRYLIKITDPSSGHICSKTCYIDYYGSERASQLGSGAATMLKFATDKPKYKVGESAVVSFPSAQNSRALVCVESGSKILNSFWVDCEKNQTQITIPLDENCTPNVYLHISLIQPHKQTLNDAPMRLYGVVPIFVEDPKTQLTPVISMPDVIRPEQEFTVKVSEKTGRQMSYTIAIVDDGLLDLTRFKTPDPWKKFFEREALGIRTWDLYDLVIGAYGGKIDGLFAIGGDGEIINKSAAKAQRFKPVVRFLGPFTLKENAAASHKIKLPPYIGSVRTMVVASSGKAFGSAEKTSQVRKPLMVSATLPRVIGTEEEFHLPVTVFAMEKNVKNVTVTLNEHANFKVIGSKTQSVSFSATGEKMVYFRLKASEVENVGKIKVTAVSGNENASESLEISIRNPNPYSSHSFIEVVEAGKTYSGSLNLIGIKGTNTGGIEVSSVPPLNLSVRLDYLLRYPHGCLEQTISAAFPQLYLKDVANTTAEINARSEKNVKAALAQLQKFQLSDGGFGYWQGERYANIWASSYVGHFLIEAERMGYALPVGMKNKWINYSLSAARSNRNSAFEQAYRLYVLALAKKPERAAMNRLYEQRENISTQACWLLAGAFALDGKTNIANTIIKDIGKTKKEAYSAYNSISFGSTERDDAIILSVLTAINDKKQGFLMVKKISDVLNSNVWLSTQSTAWCLMAVSQYIDKNKDNSPMSFNYTVGNNKNSLSTHKSVSEEKLNLASLPSTSLPIKFTNEGKSTLYVRFFTRGLAAIGKEEEKSENLSIRITYQDANGNAVDVSKLKHGTDFEAVVSVTNPGVLGDYTNLVLTQIFPSGWEIRNERLNFDQSAEGNNARYQDIRDDRVYTYFDLRRNETKRFKVKLTATYRGRFYLPAQTCEAMYTDIINASTVGRWCEVDGE